MIDGGFRHLLVVNGGELEGILSMRDIVRCWAQDRVAYVRSGLAAGQPQLAAGAQRSRGSCSYSSRAALIQRTIVMQHDRAAGDHEAARRGSGPSSAIVMPDRREQRQQARAGQVDLLGVVAVLCAGGTPLSSGRGWRRGT